jgi:hypothetical protein
MAVTTDIPVSRLQNVSDRTLVPAALKKLRDELEAAVAAQQAGAVGLQKRSLRITFDGNAGSADLNAAATTQTFSIGAVLPANARIVSVNVPLATPAAGGGASACVVALGTAGDPVALVSSADVFSAAVDGQASAMTLGKAPFKLFASAGAQLQARVTVTGANASALTAADFTVEVFFQVAA